MFILVNESPTEEISIQRGLKQGGPLPPFLFLLVAEEDWWLDEERGEA